MADPALSLVGGQRRVQDAAAVPIAKEVLTHRRVRASGAGPWGDRGLQPKRRPSVVMVPFGGRWQSFPHPRATQRGPNAEIIASLACLTSSGSASKLGW